MCCENQQPVVQCPYVHHGGSVMSSLLELVNQVNLEQEAELIETIANDVNETIRLEYRLGGSFTERDVETLINQYRFSSDYQIEFEQINDLVDYNLIGA